MKKLFFFCLALVLANSAFSDDFLARVSKGNLSDHSVGVKKLNLEEMKEVKGGYYPVEVMCGASQCFAFADHLTAARNKTFTPREEAAWRTATLESDPANSSYFIGFMAQNNWAISGQGKRYNYFTYAAVMLDARGKVYALSSSVLNNNLIIRQLSIQYKNQFDRHFGGLQIK
ncbi:hypothetical protein DMB95_07040 [Campylobacter sp. MIT 12-8780]|uniref:hypothetical protein n=1 Tax=unclassified Campylobacter TaxID=2593542 RepID=UPI00115C779A|nr:MULTISPECIES: hypothetical protein [unclassified Campylobacter]NDJ27836.1 hypothetical protein [Campylobacter sp. MIT 19-121]TQR40581.1 hypothetical protein DMB95_07040 [Campylobacter sp. MIT 12-8780]